MAKGIREIRRSIKSTKNTRQITKAMKMVAAAKLRRNQEKAEAARPYADKIQEVIASIASGTSGSKHPMLQSRPVKKTGYIVITSDRGLAGRSKGRRLDDSRWSVVRIQRLSYGNHG